MRKANVSAMHSISCSHRYRNFALWFWFVLSAHSAISQRPQYHIHAVLDTAAHLLTGTIDITYVNRSSTPLQKLGIHLWANAYSSKTSALVNQMLSMGHLESYNATPGDMGGFSKLSFSSVGRQIELAIDQDNMDIGWLILDNPLSPGDTIHLSSPFRLKIPASYSRLGRKGKTYQLTQWYPHLAVYDGQGWHMLPNLDVGEYFNDFADYAVRLTVPREYTLSATGILASRIEQDSHTVWTFVAENVIDFAWFASPDFTQEKLLVDVGGEKPVELNIFIEPQDIHLWRSAGEYAKRALKFYSDWLGPYPYPQMSVVSTPLGVGGGMEYPMVAQIGPVSDTAALDIVIAHEIGHTWLYGILANDERSNPWMDEGLNSFIEKQYASLYQPGYSEDYIPSAFRTAGSMSGFDALQHTSRFSHTLQPPAANPQFQSGDQYFLSAYYLPAQGLEMMKAMLGAEMIKAMFRDYYATHKFTHVTPETLQASFETTCKCDLSWFFREWIYHAHEVDYRIDKFDAADKEITIINHGEAKIPVRISSFKDGLPLLDKWINGFDSIRIIHLDKRADEVHLYDGFMGINKMRTTNVRPFKVIPRIGLLPKLESYDAPTLSLTPTFGYNLTDGFMPGIAFSSGLFPQQHFKFVIAPMYGLESKQLRGHATLRYANDLEKGPFDKYLLSFGLDAFGYDQDTDYHFTDHFVKWEPTLAVRLNPADEHSHLHHWLKYRYVHIDQFYGQGVSLEWGYYEEVKRTYAVHELAWQLRSDYVLRPFEALANVQAGEGFVRLNLQYKQHFAGRNKHMGTWIRGFAGWLPVYDSPKANVKFSYIGQSSSDYFSWDYMYDQWLGGRNAESGLFSQQVFDKDASLKTLSTVGLGEKWMIGAGISYAFPFRFLHFYLDAAVFPSAVTEVTELSYSGGAALVLVKDVFEIYLPLLESQDIYESLTYSVRDQWFERVSFKANIKLVNPVNVIDRMQLGY